MMQKEKGDSSMKIDVSASGVGPMSRHHLARACFVPGVLRSFAYCSTFFVVNPLRSRSCVERALHFVAEVRQAEYGVALLYRHHARTHVIAVYSVVCVTLAPLCCSALLARRGLDDVSHSAIGHATQRLDLRPGHAGVPPTHDALTYLIAVHCLVALPRRGGLFFE
jgi:hypothetical protein